MFRLMSISYGLFVGVIMLALFLSGEGDLRGWFGDYLSCEKKG